MDLALEEPIYDAVAEDEEALFAINNHLNGVGKSLMGRVCCE